MLWCDCGDFKRKLLTYQKPLCTLWSWGPSHSLPDNHTWSCPPGSGTPESRCRGLHTRQCLWQKTDLMSNTNAKDSTCSNFNARKPRLLAVKLNQASQTRKWSKIEAEDFYSRSISCSRLIFWLFFILWMFNLDCLNAGVTFTVFLVHQAVAWRAEALIADLQVITGMRAAAIIFKALVDIWGEGKWKNRVSSFRNGLFLFRSLFLLCLKL